MMPIAMMTTVIAVVVLGCRAISTAARPAAAIHGIIPHKILLMECLGWLSHAATKRMHAGFASSPGMMVIPRFSHLVALLRVTPQRGKDQQQQNDNNTVNRQGRFLQMMVIKIRHKQHRRCSDRRIRGCHGSDNSKGDSRALRR